MSAKAKKEIHLEIAHVLFMDVVGYSKLLVNEQREVVRQLNQIVRKTAQFRKSEASGKLISIPSGDGMALVFFQSPEEPVQCAMEIARALKNHPHIRLRMGVHSGPVDQVKDVNDRVNVTGVGINVARRVMDCGDAGHILLSKRVADDLAQDRHWHPLLHDLGEIEVKHGVKLGVVNLYSAELGNPKSPGKLRPAAPAEKAAASSASVRDIPEKSIAVLPFENLSADPENAFFTGGVQDEILTYLAKIADLKVISRTSVMPYKSGRKRNLREIAAELGVANLVEGSVQRAANRVRVSAQLIDARTDTHLWSEHYHRPLDDVFAIQSEIAKAISGHLQAKLSPAEKAGIEQQPTADLAAYDRYVRGKALLGTSGMDARAGENAFQAVRLLEQAVARDRAFLLAYCQLAYAHNRLYYAGYDHKGSRLALANEAVNKALELGPNRGEAHLAAATVSYSCYLDFERARAELAIARQTLPNEPFVFALAGYMDRRQGRWEEHIENLERAVQVDPRNLDILHHLAESYKFLRRFSDMAAVLDRTLTITPADALSRVFRASVDLDWRVDTRPLRATIHDVVAEDPNAAAAIADQWLDLALCEHDPDEAERALASIPREGIATYLIKLSRPFYEGLAARARGDGAAARSAFTAARFEMKKIVDEQPDYPEGLCVLGMIDAGLGRKEDALREGRRAVELLPVTKDALCGAQLTKNLAIIYTWTGEKELALNQLTIALQIPCPISYGELRLHPYWDPIRDDLRFEKLVEEAKKPVALK